MVPALRASNEGGSPWSRPFLFAGEINTSCWAVSTTYPDRSRKLFGAVALGHVDDSLHRRNQFVDVADIGKIALRCPAQGFRRDTVEQNKPKIAFSPTRRLAGVELFPAEMKHGVQLFTRDCPVGNDMRVLADQREPLIRM